MTKDEAISRINELLKKAPNPASIETVQTARNFKNLCAKAKGAKTAQKAQEFAMQLEAFYK